jgi:hypothetical protein
LDNQGFTAGQLAQLLESLVIVFGDLRETLHWDFVRGRKAHVVCSSIRLDLLELLESSTTLNEKRCKRTFAEVKNG